MFDKYGFKGLLALVTGGGEHQGRYDFVYLPHDFDRNVNLGYAFVNLVSGESQPLKGVPSGLRLQ